MTTVNGVWSIVFAPGLTKVMVWLALVTVIVRVTEVAGL